MKGFKSLGAGLVATCLVVGSFFGVYSVSTHAAIPEEPDIMNVDFSTGSAADTTGSTALVDGSGSTVTFNPDLVLGQKVATFDGQSGFGYTLSESAMEKIANGYTIELAVKISEVRAGQAVFGNHFGNKGFSLITDDTQYMIYSQKSDSSDTIRQCWFKSGDSDGYTPNEWMHIVMTCDPSNADSAPGKMYVNGVKYDSYSVYGGSIALEFPDSNIMYIGGNNSANGFTEGMTGSIAYFKMTSGAATAEEVAALASKASAIVPDLFCADYSTGNADQTVVSGATLKEGTGSTATLVKDETLGRKVAKFDSASGFGYTMPQATYDAMNDADGYSIETLVKLDELPTTTNEYGSGILGSMNDGVGFGFMGTADDYLDYWLAEEASGGNYRQLYYHETLATDQWLHLMVIYNADAGQFEYYVNGVYKDYVSPSSQSFLADPANILYVGGLPDADGNFRQGMKGEVSFVKMYSKGLSAAQVATLYTNAVSVGTSNPDIEEIPASNTNSSGQEYNATFDSENVIVSFAEMSDIHIQPSATAMDDKFVAALNKAKELAGGSDNLAGVLVAGDIADSEPTNVYPRIKDILDANLDSTKTEFLAALGNHDAYPGATGKTLMEAFGAWVYKNPVEGNTSSEVKKGNYHTVINGIHFISVYGVDGNHTSSDLEWLEKQLKIASQDTPTMPIIVYSHVLPANTVINDASDANVTPERWSSTTIAPVLAKYPQAVYFAGHSHATADIWGTDSTYHAIGSGVLASNANFVQIDKDGHVQISVYNSANTANGMTLRNVWTFDTPDPLPGDGDDDSGNNSGNNGNNSGNNGNNSGNNGNNSGNNSTGGNTTTTSEPSTIPQTGENLAGLLVASVALTVAAVVIISKKRKVSE